MQRVFTLDEARALLPRVRTLAAALRDRKADFDRHRDAFELLSARAPGEGRHLRGPLERHRVALEQLIEEIKALAEETQALGAEIKGIEQGLIDFPAERDGCIVYLCWMLDEPDIAYWHDLDAGFRGRQPLE